MKCQVVFWYVPSFKGSISIAAWLFCCSEIYEELKRLEKVSNDNEELIIVVEMIATIMKGMVNEYDG